MENTEFGLIDENQKAEKNMTKNFIRQKSRFKFKKKVNDRLFSVISQDQFKNIMEDVKDRRWAELTEVSVNEGPLGLRSLKNNNYFWMDETCFSMFYYTMKFLQKNFNICF